MEYLNQWSLVLIILLTVVPAVVVFILIRKTGGGTDHCYHLTLIEQIRQNRHRFVRRLDFLLIKPENIYPQLIHWCLSFFKKDRAEVIGTYLSVLFMLLSAGMLVGFTYLIYPHVSAYTSLPSNVFVAGVLAIYVLVPNAYSSSNAKNKGMSGRSVGLFLCEMYLYLMILYVLGEGSWLLLPAIGVVTIILMSNIFAMQFILFSSILLSLFFWNGMFLIVSAAGAVVFMAILPRYSICYYKSQWEHKRDYCNYISEHFLLRTRASIWRDFVWEFWLIARNRFGKTPTGISGLQYIYYNSVVIVLIAIPAVTVTLIAMAFWFFDSPVSLIPTFASLNFLLIPICAALLIFWATSFRKTRFLGEPERYVEITSGLLSIVAGLILFPHPLLYFLFLGFSVAFVSAHLFMYIRFLRNRRSDSTAKIIDRIHQVLLVEQENLDKPIRILSNNLQHSKSLLDVRFSCFWGNTLPEFIAGIRFSEALGEFPLLAPFAIYAVAKDYEIDYLVIDLNEIPEPESIMADKNVSMIGMITEGPLHLYRIDWAMTA
ncbi:MAG: hypothetical protein P8M22_02080 [Phycisphaerales bacterium]|nr:hypothetical protein [Phycisphaerales bacterium]